MNNEKNALDKILGVSHYIIDKGQVISLVSKVTGRSVRTATRRVNMSWGGTLKTKVMAGIESVTRSDLKKWLGMDDKK